MVRGWRVRRHMPAYRRRLRLHDLTARIERRWVVSRRWRSFADASSHAAAEKALTNALELITSSPIFRRIWRIARSAEAEVPLTRKHALLCQLRLRLQRPAYYPMPRVTIPSVFRGELIPLAVMESRTSAWSGPFLGPRHNEAASPTPFASEIDTAAPSYCNWHADKIQSPSRWHIGPLAKPIRRVATLDDKPDTAEEAIMQRTLDMQQRRSACPPPPLPLPLPRPLPLSPLRVCTPDGRMRVSPSHSSRFAASCRALSTACAATSMVPGLHVPRLPLNEHECTPEPAPFAEAIKSQPPSARPSMRGESSSRMHRELHARSATPIESSTVATTGRLESSRPQSSSRGVAARTLSSRKMSGSSLSLAQGSVVTARLSSARKIGAPSSSVPDCAATAQLSPARILSARRIGSSSSSELRPVPTQPVSPERRQNVAVARPYAELRQIV